jgi:hypothetical protein
MTTKRLTADLKAQYGTPIRSRMLWNVYTSLQDLLKNFLLIDMREEILVKPFGITLV